MEGDGENSRVPTWAQVNQRWSGLMTWTACFFGDELSIRAVLGGFIHALITMGSNFTQHFKKEDQAKDRP